MKLAFLDLRRARARPLRSVGGRLSLALVIVVAVALGVVYAIVVPSLERNLIQNKLDQLTSAAEGSLNQVPAFGFDPGLRFQLQDFLEGAAATTNSRVLLLEPLDLRAQRLRVMADSREGLPATNIRDDRVALDATLTLTTQSGIVTRDDRRFAEVAIPIPLGIQTNVLLFTSPLDDTLANVDHVARRVLVAGAIGLLVALLLGYGGASVFARRIRRLERAAERIADGQLDEPVVDRGSDELGELAQAFERMRQRLERVERARREFVANASHELRTPLFSLGGFLELMRNEELDEETRREFLGTMQEQVERLGRLATDLLDLSRLDAGRLHVEHQTVDLVELAGLVAAEFAPAARVDGRPVEVIAADEATRALADEQRVMQIGRALVENAFRHTLPGTPVRIRVGLRGGEAMLAVEDEGRGIAAEHAPQVFQRFYRVEGTRASGSGLGLAIARELAEAMSGRLELDSRPGRTVFRLYLPVEPVVAPATAPPVRLPA
jgi:signal transduction histidine kinase